MDLAEKVEIKWRHAIIVGHTGEEIHQNKLTISFPAIARFFIAQCLCICAAFHDNNGRCTTPSYSY